MMVNQRDLFEIPSDVTYLNCATLAPQLKSVTEAGLASVRLKAHPWRLNASNWFTGAETLRGLVGRLLGVDSESIALVPAASYGIATAAANLPVTEGSSILLLDQEFPSNVYIWHALARKNGARVETVRREPGESWTEAVLRSIDQHTAIISVPQCHWTDGSILHLEAVGEKCRAVGAALVIDASQSLGACRLDMARVQPDFLTSVGYKWLLGPYSLGYLYVAPKWQQAGVPLEQSWLTRAGSEDFARLVDYRDDYRPGARRFDMGEFPQFVLAPMAVAALEQILAWQIPLIEQSLQKITNHVACRATTSGLVVLPPEHRAAHMIGIRFPNGLPDGLAAALEEARIFVSLRGDAVRIAPHLYNDFADVDRLFEVLNNFL